MAERALKSMVFVLVFFFFEDWKGNQLDAKVMELVSISWLDKCRKYNHFIGYISNSNFKFKTNFCVCCFLLQSVFFKLITIFVFFVFILFDIFCGSIKTEKSQKIFLPKQKIISVRENFCAPACTLAKFYLRKRNGHSREGSITPSCPLG